MKLSRRSTATPLGALLSLSVHSALAAQAQVPPTLPASAVSMGGVLQMLFGLAVVLGTVAGAAWLLKRLAPGQIAAGGTLKLIGAIAVGPKERVVVVEVGETWLVLGVAPGQVNALHNMPRLPAGVDGAGGGVPDQRFSAWLRDVMARRGANSEK